MIARLLAERRRRRDMALPAYTVVWEYAVDVDPTEVDPAAVEALVEGHLELLLTVLHQRLGLRTHGTGWATMTRDGRLSARAVVRVRPMDTVAIAAEIERLAGNYANARLLRGERAGPEFIGLAEDPIT